MNKTFALALLCATGLSAMMPLKAEEKKDSAGFVFTDVRVVKSTPVKDQNKSGTCWCFSGNAFLEDEIIRKGGKPVNLSEMFVVRNCYNDKAERFVRLYGTGNFSQGGSALDVPYVWKKYGIVPLEVYEGLNYGETNHVHNELESAMSGYVKAIAARPNRNHLSTAWKQGLNGILDAYFGEVPETFVVDGKTYTPKTYAESLGINIDDYIPLTSFNHHPFYEGFAFEVPDNWIWEDYYNLPLDEFMAVIDNAVENGYPMVWAADVSEPGFKWKNGVALMPADKKEADMEGTELARWVKLSDAEKKNELYNFNGPVAEIDVTQELRQDMFDRQETTDDHGMEIVGYATDQKGNRYYKVRNSWTDNQIYGGYFYASVPRDAIPKEIAKKLNQK